jgi:hypothetical protein
MAQFFRATLSILDAGPTLWNKISQGQAIATLQSVATGSADVESEKEKLKHEILAGDISDRSVLNARLDTLRVQLVTFKRQLTTFGYEIDQSSPGNGSLIRATAENVIMANDSRLYQVANAWGPDKPSQERAARQLEVSIAFSKSLALVAMCLKNSVISGTWDGHPECSKESIQKR